MIKAAIIFGVSAILQGVIGQRWYSFPLIWLAMYSACGGWKRIKIISMTFKRDIRMIWISVNVQRKIKGYIKDKKTVAEIFRERCAEHPNRVALINAETGFQLTFGEADKLSNQVANIFHNRGYKEGDCVALIMDGCPEYVCYWIGLAKIGVITGLVNINLRGESLAHCLNITNAKAVIFGGNYTDVVNNVMALVSKDMEYYCTDKDDACETSTNLSELFLTASAQPLPKPEGQNMHSTLIYLFTSGTTGFPKAAKITSVRYSISALGLLGLYGGTPEDIMYIALPIYHATGGMGVVGNCVVGGITLVIRKKFSASKFLDDCIKYKCTISFYIGEICRYLLAQPKRLQDTQHNLRLFLGSGLKSNIWEEVKSRFNLPLIGEFYGSTEGCGMANTVGKIGASGFMPSIIPNGLYLGLVKVDVTSGEVIRGPNGLGIHCNPGEPGELMSPYSKDAGRDFDGYLNKAATSKKYVRNVYKTGDVFVRTGDIFVQDELGFLYFLDRNGDTFRWKGENVSTAEVESIISKVLELRDVVAYGVEIPGTEGRAGMVTIADPENQVDLNLLADRIKEVLPPYARPVFVRISTAVAVTGSFKYKKVDLRNAGFDLDKVGDDVVFVFDSKAGKYVKLDTDLEGKILRSEVRF